MLRSLPLLVGFWLCLPAMWSAAHAQDPIYSQTQATWSYANPSLTAYHEGITFRGLRRDQWRPIQRRRSQFTTNSFNLNWQVPCIKSGFGVFYNQSAEGEGNLRWDSYGINYAFIASFGRPQSYPRRGTPSDLRLGISLNRNQRRLDWENLVFTGQLDPLFGIVSSQNVPINITRQANVSYTSVSAGASFRHYSKARDMGFRVGIAAHHLNKPRTSLLGNNDVRLPWRWTAHGSIQMDQVTSLVIIPAFKIDWQSSSTLSGVFSPDPNAYTYWSVSYGGFLAIPPSNRTTSGLYGGLWLQMRKPLPDWDHTTSLVSVLGIIVKQRESSYNIGLSYDLNLGGVGTPAGGAFELSLIFNLPNVGPCGSAVCHPYSKYPRPLYF